MFGNYDKSTTDKYTYNMRLVEFALGKLYSGVDRYGERHVAELMDWLRGLNSELAELAAARENALVSDE